MKYILILIYIICTTGGITFMKLGGDSLSIVFKNGFTFKIGLLTFVGFLPYFISFILWQRMIIKYNISTMVPIVTGIVQIIVLLLGCYIFKESISLVSLIGIIMIIVGIVLMAIGSK